MAYFNQVQAVSKSGATICVEAVKTAAIGRRITAVHSATF
jgi:hypothetical protein